MGLRRSAQAGTTRRSPSGSRAGTCVVLAGLLLVLATSGCGGGDDNAPQGQTIDAEEIIRNNKNADRLAELEREVARQRRERRRGSGSVSPGGQDALGGFDELARQLSGEVGATLGPAGTGEISQDGDLQTAPAWSTIKVPIALRVIADAGGPGALSADRRAQIARAITQSDNAAAAQLFGGLASRHGGTAGAAGAVTAVLREAGDTATEVSTEGRDGFSPYGQTEWSLGAQHRFMAALAGGCGGDPAARRHVLTLMGEVRSDRWGLGSAGVPARWKGGWGPGTDGRYVVRQMGVFDLDETEVVVTLAARPADGRFASGQLMATRVARWLAQRASRVAAADGC